MKTHLLIFTGKSARKIGLEFRILDTTKLPCKLLQTRCKTSEKFFLDFFMNELEVEEIFCSVYFGVLFLEVSDQALFLLKLHNAVSKCDFTEALLNNKHKKVDSSWVFLEQRIKVVV